MGKVKFKKLHEHAIVPKYAHPGDAGMDFYSCEDCSIKPNERKVVKTGIAMAIPDGFVGLVWDKSGIAAKKGIKTMAGVIDAGYRGEVGIVLHNTDSKGGIERRAGRTLFINGTSQRNFTVMSAAG